MKARKGKHFPIQATMIIVPQSKLKNPRRRKGKEREEKKKKGEEEEEEKSKFLFVAD